MVLLGILLLATHAGIARDNDVGNARVQKAYELRVAGDVDGARELLTEETQARPENALAWFERARAEFYRVGVTMDLAEAQKAIDKAIKLDPTHVESHYWAGKIATYNFILLAHEKKTDAMVEEMARATRALQRALELDPKHHNARRELIACYGNNPDHLGGDREKAETHVKILEVMSPIDGARARTDFERGESKERVRDRWLRIVNQFPEDPRAKEGLALHSLWTGDLPKALELADQVVAVDPARPIFLEIALHGARNRQFEDAERSIRRYLESNPPAALRAYGTMVLARIQQGQGHADANVTIKKAREIDSYCWFTMRPPPEELFVRP